MSEKLTISGVVKHVGETQEFGTNGFCKREFVVVTDEKYPQEIPFEVVKDRCRELDALVPGSQVEVSFNLRGREYNGKWYVNLQAWRWEVGAAPATGGAGPAGAEPEQADDAGLDDLPF